MKRTMLWGVTRPGTATQADKSPLDTHDLFDARWKAETAAATLPGNVVRVALYR